MFLIAFIVILFVFFVTTRYGTKSESKNVRVISYIGIFLSVALLTMMAVLIIGEKIKN